MALNLSHQQIEEMGQMWGDVLLPTIPLEKRLAGANPIEVMNNFNPEQRFNAIKLSFSVRATIKDCPYTT